MTPPESREAPERARLDKWLWRARIYKTRTLAAAAVSGGKIRVNGARVLKPGYGLKAGDVLTIARAGQGGLLLELKALGDRRGPAAEARLLYADLAAETAKPAESEDDGDATVAPPPDPRAASRPPSGEV